MPFRSACLAAAIAFAFGSYCGGCSVVVAVAGGQRLHAFVERVNPGTTSMAAAPRTVTSEFRVGMTCDGCAGAVKKALAKVDGVSSIETDVATQHVIVTHAPTATVDALLGALHKWAGASGKVVAVW